MGMFTKIIKTLLKLLFLLVSQFSIHDTVSSLFLVLFCNSEVEQIDQTTDQTLQRYYKDCMPLKYLKIYRQI